jgi:hypothetical protein
MRAQPDRRGGLPSTLRYLRKFERKLIEKDIVQSGVSEGAL